MRKAILVLLVIAFQTTNIFAIDINTNTSSNNYIISVAPLRWLNGEIPIYFEKSLTGKFSFEGMLGLTYRYPFSGTFHFFSQDKSIDYAVGPSKYQLGFQGQLGFKYYFSTPLSGWYSAIFYRYSKHESTTRDFATSVQYDFLNLTLGHQVNLFNSRMVLNTYFGLGVKLLKLAYVKRIVTIYYTEENNYYISEIDDNDYKQASKHEYYPSVKFGLTVGFSL